jgi:hypothetical protein
VLLFFSFANLANLSIGPLLVYLAVGDLFYQYRHGIR